tara:strand:- start:363 stop:773 length:411 start_codon:yes stop_codon:yes gene_type:complete
MAHFAQLDDNNVVTQVIVIGNDDTSDHTGREVESIGVAFCKKLLGSDTRWKQTSYNGNIRVRYAGIGFTYDENLDAFLEPKPFNSWTINIQTATWEAPLTRPALTSEQEEAGQSYTWDEDAYQADNTTGWVLQTGT